MAQLTIREFRRQFASVIDRRDEIVVVYSGIWTFGHRFGISPKQLPELLIEAMLEALGSGRTLLLPAYTYAYTGTRRFSPANSQPETGVLPVALLRDIRHVRTRSALNSFLALGPRAVELAEKVGESLWGEGSLKCLFERSHARMIVLGLPWKDACGYLHRIEEVCAVPYRYYKTFHGIWDEAGATKPWVETMYVRPLTLLPVFRWHMVDDLLRARGQIAVGGGEIHIESADAAEIVAAGAEILDDDKLALLVNRAEIAHWIETGKAAEIEQLRRAEPRALDYFDHQTRG